MSIRSGIRRRLGVSGVLLGLLAGGVLSGPVTVLADPPPPSITPSSVTTTINAGDSFIVNKAVQTPVIPPKSDIVFLADTTGSMGATLDNVRDNAAPIMNAVRAADSDSQFGAAHYNDFGDAVPYNLSSAISANIAAVDAAISADWTLDGGGDTPEAQLNALHQLTLPATGFRAGSTKIIVWFGDSSGHDPSNGNTLASVIADLTGAGIIVIAVPVASGGGDGLDSTGQASAITAATGGTLVGSTAPADVSAAILAALEAVRVDVSMVSDCTFPISATFAPAVVNVQSGDVANFVETITVDPTADLGVVYECDDHATINGNPMLDAAGNLITEHKTITACTHCARNDDGSIKTVTVDEPVVVDLNPAIPTCDDGATPDLCDFFSWDKSSTDASKWNAIFDVKAQALIIKDNATVTVKGVGGGNNQKSPGIIIKGTCTLTIEGDTNHDGKLGGVVVTSVNQQAGDILLQFNGNITIDGLVRNQVMGTNGRPGKITIASCCGDVVIGSDGHPEALVETLGADLGGNDINILTCCVRGADGAGGDIVITGTVRALHKSGPTPTINIVALVGAVTIDGRNDLGLETKAGTLFRRTSGVYTQALSATSTGSINIQALNNVTVYGNHILDKNRTQFGAVAIKSNNTNGLGGNGSIKAISLTGGVRALDRAFDADNRFDAGNSISLAAANDINLAVSAFVNDGAANNTKAVVSTQGGSAGKGGSNSLLASGGQVSVGANALVRADAPGGANGTNVLAGCTGAGVVRTGTVTPMDALGDDTSCPAGPVALFTSCAAFGVPFDLDMP
jgi:hypothetical protein